jgi:hypothetical protein
MVVQGRPASGKVKVKLDRMGWKIFDGTMTGPYSAMRAKFGVASVAEIGIYDPEPEVCQ